jgi:hypothetical protein
VHLLGALGLAAYAKLLVTPIPNDPPF